MGHSLHKDQRLKSRKQIEILFASGQSISEFPFRVIFKWNSPGGNPSLKFGVSVPSRYFKRAVDRNVLKRRIREAWRLQRQSLEIFSLHVFFVYTGKEVMDYKLISEKVAKLIKKLKESHV